MNYMQTNPRGALLATCLGAHGNLHLNPVQVAGSQVSCATRWQQVFTESWVPQ